MSQIKERPILFSAPMVRAILEGRKTVTRRGLPGYQIPMLDTDGQWLSVAQRHRQWGFAVSGETEQLCAKELETSGCCPYGKPGDRLWVRETWARVGNCDPGYLAFGATYPDCLPPELENIPAASEIRWKPSIHMFRRDSRILLEITDVRVERLQDISEEQAQAEGCFFTDYGRKCGHTGSGWTEVGDCPAPEAHHPQRNGWMWDKTSSSNECLGTATWAFANLWQSVGGAWDLNPWVWAVEFKRVTP